MLACGLRPGDGGQGTGGESVDPSLAGFAVDPGGESVDVSLAGFGSGRRPQPPGGRIATPAALQGLERALDEGAKPELPDNRPPGILGESGLDIHKVDTFEYQDDAGLVQEGTYEELSRTDGLFRSLVQAKEFAAHA